MASLKSSHQRQKARLSRVRHIINLIEETKNGGHLSGREAIPKQLFPKDYAELLAQVDERDSDFQHYFNHHLRYEYRESSRGNSQFVIYILSAFRVSIQASIDYSVMSWMETVKHDGGNAVEVKTTAGRVRSTRDANIRMGNKLLRPDSSFRYRGYKGHPSIVFEIAWSQSTANLKKKAVELIHESAGQIRTVVGFDFSETYNIWPMIRDRVGTKNLPNRGPATAFIWRAMYDDNNQQLLDNDGSPSIQERSCKFWDNDGNSQPNAHIQLSLKDFIPLQVMSEEGWNGLEALDNTKLEFNSATVARFFNDALDTQKEEDE